MNNRFIVVEGLDGSGKTTIVSYIVGYLHNHNITNIITTHEPGGTPIADVLRNLLIVDNFMNESITDISELLILYAARSQLLENIIRPALIRGDWVIGDRWDLSSFAYQGGGRGIDNMLLNMLSERVINNLLPDLIFYLDISPEIGFLRIKNKRKLDRIEQESLIFFDRVRAYYKKLAALQKNVITIDANQDLKTVFMSIYQCLDEYLLTVK